MITKILLIKIIKNDDDSAENNDELMMIKIIKVKYMIWCDTGELH